jgi:hypothetical protein
MTDWERLEWRGLYGEGWGAEIVPDAFTHPAKYSRALIRRIYQEMLGRGWLAEGDTVIDPFGGVALGGLDAMLAGLNYQGCELEPRFVALAQANIDLWNKRYGGRMPHWGTARIVQGDSRRLRTVLSEAGGCVTSPPYASSDQDYKAGWKRFHDGHEPLWRNDSQRDAEYGTTPGQLGAMPEGVVSSPPYIESLKGDKSSDSQKGMAMRAKTGGAIVWGSNANGSRSADGYGATDGNLGNMPAGDAAISSPPFLQTSGGLGVKPGAIPGSPTADPRLIARHAAGNAAAEAYGQDAANLGNMREGDAVVSSPPFENSRESKDLKFIIKAAEDANNGLNHGHGSSKEYLDRVEREKSEGYGETPGNVGNDTGDTFWSAARLIVAETYAVLRPGAHAAWVVKSFVRNKRRVNFPDQWRRLCESVGFVTIAEVHALLIEDRGTSLTLDGGEVRHIIKRASFFRRLAEKKGSPPIDWETVWLMKKPLANVSIAEPS